MKNIKVVIGANFGDEGKGLMTDYFCDSLGEKTLNIRFNGTSQAGHTVWRGNKRHVFSHFGSGSFCRGVATYLSSMFFFNPVSYFQEMEELERLNVKPEVYLCNDSNAITIYDVFFNCIVETARGNGRHGSCGAGLWEAVNRVKAGFVIKAADMNGDEASLRKKLIDIRDVYYQERFKSMGIAFDEQNEWYEVWHSETARENYIHLFFEMKKRLTLADERTILNEWDKQVYEGAQGLLLDYDNREYMPNLTASNTGCKNVVQLVNEIDEPVDLEVCYVTRTYFTRHGAGRFNTEADKCDIERWGRLLDDTNVTNRWQGSFRWGYFDEELFEKTVSGDARLLDTCTAKGNIKCAIAFAHADCTDSCIITRDGKKEINKYVNELDIPFRTCYLCKGKTAGNVTVQN